MGRSWQINHKLNYGQFPMSWVKGLRSYLDIFLQSHCPLCERSTTNVVCPNCQRQLQQCRLNPAYSQQQEALSVLGWGSYGGALKRAIASLKYENHPELARPLGQWLAQSWLSSLGSKKAIVVPIPMHPDKVAQRGFNQAELIAQAFCETTGLPLKRHGLARVIATEAQFTLSPSAREQNLAGAFVLSKDFQRQRPTETVLLLDDIYTTGATVRSAAQVLRRSQISVWGVGAVAIAGQGFTKEKTDDFDSLRR
jgi:ComF family protein